VAPSGLKSAPAGIWFARRHIDGGSMVEVAGYAGNAQPDGLVVDVSVLPQDDEPVVVAHADAATLRVRDVRLAPALFPAATRLWFVEHPEPSSRPPAMTLIAFDARVTAPGDVIDQAAFTELPVQSSAQIAAIRWWTGTGQIHQVYVAPALRRRGFGTAMTLAAGGYRAARGWAPLWTSGERTELGEAMATATAMLSGRVMPRTRVLPPMTPQG